MIRAKKIDIGITTVCICAVLVGILIGQTTGYASSGEGQWRQLDERVKVLCKMGKFSEALPVAQQA